MLLTIADAVRHHRPISIRYTDRHGRHSERTVHAHGIVAHSGRSRSRHRTRHPSRVQRGPSPTAGVGVRVATGWSARRLRSRSASSSPAAPQTARRSSVAEQAACRDADQRPAPTAGAGPSRHPRHGGRRSGAPIPRCGRR
ncbi:WYL domain-containing protein [Nocardia neocaledoniensis]|uniref:WYL domain-containing protein n=1 Tax=Nocardia neocaledoniensis TaxID=236511 RepID=UPI001FC97ABF|nr:WYL domain-containing protein [Nocardia neocaledoniensis]